MDEEDTMFKLSLSIDSTIHSDKILDTIIENLYSKETTQIYDTIIKIKNLIIGNNKYKTYYLRDELINRLIELINDLYINYLHVLLNDHEKNDQILIDNTFLDLVNQILVIFGSFALGNLEHLTKLINNYKIHLILFNIVHLNSIFLRQSHENVNNFNFKIIETTLRSISNLYSSSQISSGLIYQLDKVLYHEENNHDIPPNLKSLVELFSLNNTTKSTILNIISISSFNLMISTSIKSNSEQFNDFNIKNRLNLIKSNLIYLFSGLLTSLQPKIQLNCLKFYASMSFECLESTKLILNTSYYDYSLLDLISSFLSRENNAELQLYSAKCLTNICRSSLISKLDDMDLNSNEYKLVNFNSKLIKLKVLPTLIRLCSTYSNYFKNSNSSKYDFLSLSTSTIGLQNKKHLNTFFLIEILSTLSYLVELSSYLQQTASCLEQVIHLIVSNILIGFNNLSSNTLNNSKLHNKNRIVYNLNKTSCTSLFSLFYLYYNQFSNRSIYFLLNEHQYRVYNGKKFNLFEEYLIYKRLISVSFQTLACLASNSEESRRIVSDNSDLLSRLIESIEIKDDLSDLDDDFNNLTDYRDIEDKFEGVENVKSDATLLRISSLCLLHSLSRSVQQLRTRFLDTKLWNCIIDLIQRLKAKKVDFKYLVEDGVEEKMEVQFEKEDDFSLNEKNLISILIAILANLLIEFSPCKETLLGDDVIKILIDFVNYKNKSIRINSIWALMNLAYHADQKIKQQILAEMTFDKLFQLLTEKDEILVLKTLGLIRNLICNRPHIDHLMCFYGSRIIQAVIMVLEGEYSDKMIKEQALCILANIADGTNVSKEFIMGNEDLLRKINSFMTNNFTEIQVAAVYCVSNLVNNNDDGALERQNKLKEIGAHRILQKLLHSNDPILFEKVKSALQQFSTSTPSNNSSLNNLF